MAHSHSSYSRRRIKKYIPVLIALIALLVIGTIVLLRIDRAGAEGGPDAALEEVTINGVKCRPKGNIRTYLYMGIDAGEEHTTKYDIGGMCDVIQLLIVDNTAKRYVQLPINRNTMTEVRSYDQAGDYLGTSICQIAYAHMEGDGGGTLSCENMAQAVSKLLYGQKIDGYIAMNMDGIGILNHLAGGVPVTIEEDMTNVDPAFVEGETITLTDDQALKFVQARMSVGDGTNESRMRRQDAFIDSLKIKMTDKLKDNESYAIDVYDQLTNSMVTDFTDKEFSRVVNALIECESAGKMDIEGSVGEDEFGFATFEPDADSLADTVIDLFYRRVEE